MASQFRYQYLWTVEFMSLIIKMNMRMQYCCPVCDKITIHTTCDNICQQPKVTIVSINRFHQLSSHSFMKNRTVVYCGHYTSIVRVDNIWYSCNDNVVSVINDIDDILHSKDVYLLFYVSDNM